jgi:hypothetical protein
MITRLALHTQNPLLTPGHPAGGFKWGVYANHNNLRGSGADLLSGEKECAETFFPHPLSRAGACHGQAVLSQPCDAPRVRRRGCHFHAGGLRGCGGHPLHHGSAMESRPDSPAAPVCKAVKSTTDMAQGSSPAHNISDWPKGFDPTKMQLTDIQVLACLSVRPQSTPDPRATPLSSQGVE